MRRAHEAIGITNLIPFTKCGAYKLPNRVCTECGYYKNVLVLEKKVKIED
jgi:ribosomal protein L32